jgi:hypothetical protein
VVGQIELFRAGYLFKMRSERLPREWVRLRWLSKTFAAS